MDDKGTGFPEITSFGTLLLFAQTLENAAAGYAEDFPKAKRVHTKRGKRLELLRRERLNEVVLQPLTGLDRDEYLPPANASAGAAGLAGLEDGIARYYRDALIHGAHVLGGLERTFARFARESEDLAASLRG